MKRTILSICLLIWAVVLPDTGRAEGTLTLQAEDGSFSGSAQTSISGYSGTGYVFIKSPDTPTVNWSFSVATSGIYRLTIRFNTNYGEKGFTGAMNGRGFSGMFPFIENAWADYDAGLFELVAGVNTLQIGGGWHWYNIDKVTLTTGAPEPLLPVPATLSDPQATFAARMLMERLVEDYGSFTWAGQHEADDENLNYIYNRSGRTPTLIEGDLINYSPSRVEHGSNPGNYTEEFIELDDFGYALGLCWHWNAPTNLYRDGEPWWSGFYTRATTFNVEAALADTNSAEYALILRDIDAIAVELGKLSDAGIPVLWRPLHEAAGGWFWWGAYGPEPFKELWRLLYQRLTVHHDLHNLIWVMTHDGDPDWYPGDDVVDIVGVDAYPDDPADTLQSRWQLLKDQFDGNKPIALTEFGGIPDIEQMHYFGVWFSYFACWSGTDWIGRSPDELINQTYNSPLVITLDEMNIRPSQIVNFTVQGDGTALLEGTGPHGAGYQLLATDDLTATNVWSTVTNGIMTGGVFMIEDPQSTGEMQRFYRVVVP